jgi:hypothetical protein
MTDEAKTLSKIARETFQAAADKGWMRTNTWDKVAAAVEAEVLRRQAADTESLRADAARYRRLRHSLSGESGCSHTQMPRISAPFPYPPGEVTYTTQGLDETLDRIMAAEGKE